MNFVQDYSSFFKRAEQSPHKVLGIIRENEGSSLIRLFRPGAKEVDLKVKEETVRAACVNAEGIFEYRTKEPLTLRDYRVYHPNGLLAHDPYAFDLTLPEEDIYLFSIGKHYDLYKVMGARLHEIQGVEGVRFTVWAPSAARVSVVGNFNRWDGRVNPMSLRAESGIWELFIPGLKKGDVYKFEIKTKTGKILLKADPFALSSKMRSNNASSNNASRIDDFNRFSWTDDDWLEKRGRRSYKKSPMNIYEVHLGSWKKNKGGFYNYRELAPMLADYVLEMGFTHIELTPITEYPYDASWGYQVTGYFSPTSRFGTTQDFQYFVNHLHEKGIGVILDWVPAHFPEDSFSLGRFDGTPLYEHEDPKQGFHPHWNTLIFEFGNPKVANFLISSALFWLKEMHIDGLRVDAVASMLYLDYGRAYGEWNPNLFGGNENLEAIEFFQHLNRAVHREGASLLTIAEESTSFPGVTLREKDEGLGFDLKWNMGWMNDTLRFFCKPFEERPRELRDITFSMAYYYTEKFISSLSHDEVVHEKKSLFSKMPGTRWEKFANLRLLYSFMICHPGKKLIFMGGEFGQVSEWDYNSELDWGLLELEFHRNVHRMVKELNRLYLNSPPLWEKDYDKGGFKWVDHSDRLNCIVSYLRKSKTAALLCVHNFLNRYHPRYYLKIPGIKGAYETFNTDADIYGGSGAHCHGPVIIKDENGRPQGVSVSLPPLTTVIFEVDL